MEPRRIMLLPISRQSMLAVLQGRIRVTSFDLPSDVQIMDVEYSHTRGAFVLLLESAAFDLVDVGVEPPYLPPFTVETTPVEK